MNDEVRCPCCRLYYARERPSAFARRVVPLHPQLGVCWDCVNHQGSGETVNLAKAKHHGGMLRREYAYARGQLVDARAKLGEMQQELDDRPIRIEVRVENLDAEIVAEALAEVDEAYRRRDVAMGALSDLRLLHRRRDDDRTQCVCGKPYAKCDEGQIADGWEGIELWERFQAERAWLGEYSYLRADHPARTDRNWFEEDVG